MLWMAPRLEEAEACEQFRGPEVGDMRRGAVCILLGPPAQSISQEQQGAWPGWAPGHPASMEILFEGLAAQPILPDALGTQQPLPAHLPMFRFPWVSEQAALHLPGAGKERSERWLPHLRTYQRSACCFLYSQVCESME